MFEVPCPTPSGATARDLYDKRIDWITEEMQASARKHGCRFHRAWFAADGSAFYALAEWDSREGANAFFEEWEIDAEEGERSIVLEGDVGLVPLP
ncbi:MAG TPA: DUF3303 family protein [Actinomycetota bacterium]|nr:DUF3303 family protein [Actinomycetota bacterium]